MAWGTVTAVLPPIALSRPLGAAQALAPFWAAGAGLRAHGLFRHPRHAGRPPGRQGDDPDPARRTAFAQAAEDDSDPARARAGGLLSWRARAPPGALILAFSPLAMVAILRAYEHGAMLPGLRLEFLVESHAALAGLLALACGAVAP